MVKRNMKTTKAKGSPKPDPHANVTAVNIHDFSAHEISEIRTSLLSWYDSNKRDLPWRNIRTSDVNERAYAVWVSEIMLQQTQVATVIDYYNKWMKKWPTLQALASADIESVNEAWSGLGYYSRGRRLLEGAVKVVKELDGQMPQSAQDLQKQLPGVGRYTAGAIASIALGQATSLVDGNVIRVFSRLRVIGGNVSQPEIVEAFWSLADKLVDHERPGDFNQSLMELGATVCTPKTPKCDNCPVRSYCRGFAKVNAQKKESSLKLCTRPQIKGEVVDIECLVPNCKLCLPEDEPWDPELGVLNYPRKPKKAKVKEETLKVFVLLNKDQYLICKRPKTGLLAGLWEFPNVLETPDADNKTFVSNLLQIPSSSVESVHFHGKVNHQFSHIHHTYQVFSARVTGDVQVDGAGTNDEAPPMKWLTEEELKDAAISTGMNKVFKVYKQPIKRKSQTNSSQPGILNFFQRKGKGL